MDERKQKRPVARRACLSCREKKIKCDGEAVGKSADPSVCSNCRFLGIECVFVQSNRGGRRRKRKHELEPDTKSRNVGDGSSTPTGSQASTVIRNLEEIRLPLPSPTSQYLPFPDCRLFKHELDIDSPFEKRRDFLLMHPPHPHGHPLPGSRSPYPPPGIHGPPGTHGPYGPEFGPDPRLQGHLPLQISPFPPPHMMYYYPPPHMYGLSPPNPEKTIYTHNKDAGPMKEIERTKKHKHNDQNENSPHDKHHSDQERHPDDQVRYPENNEVDKDRDKHGSNLGSSKSSSSFMRIVPNESANPENLAVHTSNIATTISPNFAPFSDLELVNYGLPPWSQLADAVDFYFVYVNPNTVILPNRNFFLERLALKCDSSILHAMLAVVCTMHKWPFDTSEAHWVSLMHRYWDNLNDFAMFVCLTLSLQMPSVRHSFHALVEVHDKIFDIIMTNRYLDVLQTQTSMNRRKRYEHEALIRMVWIHWIQCLVFRVRQGRSYQPLPMMHNDNEFLKLSIAYLDRLPLPLPNETYVKCQMSYRPSWTDLNKGNFEDSSAPIKATLILQQVMNRIAADNLDRNSLVQDPHFQAVLLDRLYLIKNDTLILNAHYLQANLLVLYAAIIQRCHFINHLLVFESLTRSTPKNSLNLDVIPHLNDVCTHNVIDLKQLPARVAGMDDFHWVCLVDVIEQCMHIVDIVNLYLGILPLEDTPRYSVLYGVSSMDSKKDWFLSKEFIGRGETMWLKACDFNVICACMLVSVLPSLIVLRNLFQLQGSKVVFLRDQKVLEFGAEIPSKVTTFFDADNLRQSYDRVLEFLRFRSQYDVLHSLQQNTVTTLNKITHCMENILLSMK